MPESRLARIFGSAAIAAFEWVEDRPKWLRPPLYGALFIYAFMALRGAWFLLPVLLIIMAVTNPLEAWRAFLAILVYAPLGGVLGGLVYATIRSVTRSLGRLGTFIQCLGASCGYAFILSFLVLPTFKGKPMPSFSDQSEWITVAVIGMIGGIAIGIPLSRERA